MALKLLLYITFSRVLLTKIIIIENSTNQENTIENVNVCFLNCVFVPSLGIPKVFLPPLFKGQRVNIEAMPK